MTLIKPIEIGDRLPDVPLVSSRGEQVSLAGMRGEATLLIFLRHLGCLPCRSHLVEVAEHRDALSGRIVVVSFTAPQMLAALEDELQLGLDMFADPERALYQALGFGRGSVGRVWLHPRVWIRYAGLLAGGARLRGPQGDTLQLGGDAVIDAAGRLAWIYGSAGPDDRPPVTRLRKELASAGGS